MVCLTLPSHAGPPSGVSNRPWSILCLTVMQSELHEVQVQPLSPWCWCCWRFLCLCEVVDVPVSWCLPVYSDSLCTANHSSRLQAQTDSVMDGPRSIFRSTKKAKSHIIAVQLTWTEWLIWTYSHFHLPLLPLHQLLLSSLTFNFFKHPFTVLSPFGVSVAPLTSSSTSHWWAG